ncbi:MAG: TonB-dependent receptor [Gammaproteobacteria bacterium]|jgi:outer membrane receptor protein involved in Fe transport|nr:TonB-dependent receptor [Gammaproteobacteria bacterium]
MGTKTFQLSALSAAIASTLMTGTIPALAQAPALLEEVIVTATRRSESIQDIPINITALSADLIARERLQDLTDIARRVPGMTVIDQGSRSADVITVRGLNVDAIQPTDGDNDGGDSVGTYIGEIPFYVDLRLNDMERLEVLIGPQGTLYGAGTLTGAVRYMPNRPQSDEFTVQARGDVFDLSQSSDLGYEGGVTVNVPIIENTFAVRASLDYYDDPGFIDYNFLVREPGVSRPQPDFTNPDDVNANLTRRADANDEQVLSGRLGARYTTDMIDANLTYYYQDSESGARQINHQAAFGTGKYEAAHRYLEPLERENELLALEIVADLGFAELTSATGFSKYEEEGQRDQSDLLLNFEYGYETFPSFAAFTRDTAEEEAITQELRLVSTSEGPLSWIVGAFYNEFQLDSLSQEFTPGFDQWAVDNLGGVQLRPDALEYYEVREQETTEMALFGELGYDITDAWSVTIGARWFKFEDEQSGGFALPLSDTVFGGAPQDLIDVALDENKVDDDDMIFKLNTSYQINDDVMAYFTVSEGYRLGGLNSVPECPPNPDPNEQNVCALPDEVLIKSDTTTNYEFGMRTQFNDNLLINGSVYFIDWEDVQVASVTANGDIPITSNGGSAESYGVELASRYYITPELSIAATYAYNKAELTEDAPGLVDGEDAFDGDRLPGSPEHQYFLSANYSMPMDNGASLDFDWSMTGQSDVITKVGERANGESLDGYILHNVSASWIEDSYTVSLYADNLFDEFAETGVRRDRSFIRAVDQFDLRRYYNDVLRPRQVGLRFVYNFAN